MIKRFLVIAFVFASVLPVTGCWWWYPHGHDEGGYDHNQDYDQRGSYDHHGYDNDRHYDGYDGRR